MRSDFYGLDVIRWLVQFFVGCSSCRPALLLQRMDEMKRRNAHLRSQNFNKRPTPQREIKTVITRDFHLLTIRFAMLGFFSCAKTKLFGIITVLDVRLYGFSSSNLDFPCPLGRFILNPPLL